VDHVNEEERFNPETGVVAVPGAGVTLEPNTVGVAHPWYKVDYLCRDRKGAVLAHVLSFDNGPDDLVEGLRRYAERGKVGFVDARCRVIIPAAWDFAFPFAQERARVCDGCTLRPDGEHAVVVGGRELFIDRTGKVR
jgi:hypothetical protein